MTDQALPDWAQEMREHDRPIFIAASSARSGTTALHRLLNSHPDVMLHGEDPVMFDMAHLTASRIVRFMQARDDYATRRRNALEQTADEWLDAFLPPTDILMHNAFLLFYLTAKPFRDDALQFGKTRWGMKKPHIGAHQVAGVSALLRNARIIYLIRDLKGVLRSAKSFYTPTDSYQPEMLCEGWAERTLSWAKQPRTEQHFTLNYDDLDQQPERIVSQLAAFLELEGLDPTVLDSKVNVRKADSADKYVAPGSLNEEERDLIHRTERALQADLTAAGATLPKTGIGDT